MIPQLKESDTTPKCRFQINVPPQLSLKGTYLQGVVSGCLDTLNIYSQLLRRHVKWARSEARGSGSSAGVHGLLRVWTS